MRLISKFKEFSCHSHTTQIKFSGKNRKTDNFLLFLQTGGKNFALDVFLVMSASANSKATKTGIENHYCSIRQELYFLYSILEKETS